MVFVNVGLPWTIPVTCLQMHIFVPPYLSQGTRTANIQNYAKIKFSV